MSRPLAIIAAAVAQRPSRAGHAWLFLQYLLGFRDLSWDVVLVDRLPRQLLADRHYTDEAVRWFRDFVEFANLEDTEYFLELGPTSLGLGRQRLGRRFREASLLLDVNGFLGDDDLYAMVETRIFLDIDPGFNQMWHALDQARVFGRHSAYASYGQRIGAEDCSIPTAGLDWIATVPPVSLRAWPVAPGRGRDTFTSIASWRGPFEPVEYGGERYGLRVHEFRRIAELPRRVPVDMEVALDIEAEDRRDRAMLELNGWRLTDPGVVAGTLSSYRDYVAQSTGEFGVAKEMYVKAQAGWVSDRTVCYLASGRPSVVQDTGAGELLPAGEGLLLWRGLGDASEMIREVVGDYSRHSAAARQIAESHFNATHVIEKLVSQTATTLASVGSHR